MSRARRLLLRRALLGAGLLLAACPTPLGQCQADADCAAAPAGSFCAEGVCQGAPLATVDAPATTCARSGTGALRVHVARAHGGAGAATARFEAGALHGASVREADGSLRFDVPCSFGAPGSEGPAALAVFVADDLGHETKLAAALLVDDRGPALTVDPASVPASALRGAKVALRVTATDLSGVASVRFSVSAGAAHDATAQADGSFQAEVDTSEAAASAEQADVVFTGVDARGNQAQKAASFAVTRVKWTAQATDGAVAIGLALASDAVVISTMTQHLRRANRGAGAISDGPAAAHGFSGNLVVDGGFTYSALLDGSVCKFGLDGTTRWCCPNNLGPVGGSLALGLFPSGVPNVGPLPMVVYTAGPYGGADARLFGAREGTAGCDRIPSNTLSTLGLGTPSIAADGTVFLAGHGLVVASRFDGLSWLPAQSFTRATFYESQPALAPISGGGVRLVAGNGFALFESLLFAAPDAAGHRADPAAGSSTTPVAGPPTSGAPVIAEDGTVLASLPSADAVVALAPDGALRWKATLSAPPYPAPVLGAGGLVFAAAGGSVTALDLATGSKVWSWSTGGPVSAPLALGCDGVLYGATDTGLVFALVSGSAGPAGPWPREGHDPRGYGDARRTVQAGPGCAEE